MANAQLASDRLHMRPNAFAQWSDTLTSEKRRAENSAGLHDAVDPPSSSSGIRPMDLKNTEAEMPMAP